jgi:hypothetical protein
VSSDGVSNGVWSASAIGAGASTATAGAATAGAASRFTSVAAAVGATIAAPESTLGRSVASGGCTGTSVPAYAVPAYPNAAAAATASVIRSLLT